MHNTGIDNIFLMNIFPGELLGSSQVRGKCPFIVRGDKGNGMTGHTVMQGHTGPHTGLLGEIDVPPAMIIVAHLAHENARTA